MRTSVFSGGDDYKMRYQSHFDAEAEWLKRSAIERVNSIQYFLKNNSISPDSILDIGCGTGAVLQELQNRNIGNKYVGVDYSLEAIENLRNNLQGIDTYVADITSANFSFDGRFDTVIMIHVLQHLNDPEKCLKSVLKQLDFSHIIIEVPFEDLLLNKLIYLLYFR